MAGAVVSKGSKLEIMAANSTYVKVNGLTDISGVGFASPATIDVSDLDSTFKEKLPGIPDPGSPSFSFNYIPGDAGQDLIRSNMANSTIMGFRTTLASGPVFTGNAFCTAWELSGGVDKQQALSVKLEITGAVTKS